MNFMTLKIQILIPFLLFSLMLSIFFSLQMGTVQIDFSTIIKLWQNSNLSKEYIIIYDIRLPRTLLAALIGANLSVAGVLIQTLSRNPLADPKIMGVSAGAVFVIVALSFFQINISPNYFVPITFFGSFLGGLLVFIFYTIRSISIVKFVLAGVSVSSFLFALSTGMMILLGDSAGMIYSWLAGGFSGVGWHELKLILPWSILSLVTSFFISKYLNVYILGDEIAKGLGLNLNKLKVLLCILIIFLTGCSVSVSGAIGFIGLIIPHITKKVVPQNYFLIIPVSAILGALVLVLSDMFSRYLFMPNEIPVGVLTAFIGCPFFLYLIRKYS